MPRKIDFTLTAESVKILEKAIRQDPCPQARQRATAIRQLHLGKSVTDVADMMLVGEGAIYGWWHTYQNEGVEGLGKRKRKLKRRKVTAVYLEKMEEALAVDPADFGYEIAIWTREALRDHLAKETDIALSVVWLGKLMAQHEYVFRRPKHDLGNKQDAVAKEKAQEALEMLKKRPLTAKSSSSLWTKQP